MFRAPIIPALLSVITACSSAAGPPKMPAPGLGMNVNTINWWDGSRPFANLIYGSAWQMQNTSPWGGAENVPDASLDENGWVKSVPPGYQVMRGLSVPVAGGNVTCRYNGNGTIHVAGPVSNVRTAKGLTRFMVAPTYPEPEQVRISFRVDSSDYIRDIDCREDGLPPEATLAPEFEAAATGFKVIRFMKWQIATEANTPVTWATRNKPGDGDYTRRDGVPVEVLVETASRLRSDAWFTMPWNADDDYVTRFANYVRDHLAPGRKAYVEVGNEVWNGAYPVYKQACDEAKGEGLPSADSGSAQACDGERYAQKTEHIMAIWSKIFAGSTNRLVRVFAYHHLRPYWSDKYLAYRDAYKSVDALATAPYFGHDLAEDVSADQIFDALPRKVDAALDFAEKQKAVARKYGLRYITYEAGQHIVLGSKVPLLYQVQHDPRMQGAYKQFISGWQTRLGDNLTLFALTGAPSPYGSWGAVDYAGQPLTQAPKMRAIRGFLDRAPGGRPVDSQPQP